MTDCIYVFARNNTSGTEILSHFQMAGGRVRNYGGTLNQEFMIADQQGNARVSFQDSGSGTAVVRQENGYYGFGMVMTNSTVDTW